MPDPDAPAVIDAWDNILAARRPANLGHPVQTGRGTESVYTIIATGRDLDDLRAGLGAWKAAVDTARESTRHHGTLVDEAREAIRRVAGDPSVDLGRRKASLDDLRSLCGHLLMRAAEIVKGDATP